jgi:ADP-ribose diphosphatase
MDPLAARGLEGPGDPPDSGDERLRVRRERHTLPDGRRVSVEAVRVPAGVCILPLLDEDQVVLLRQYRPIVGAEIWELPAGTIEPGESPEACARRELIEEAGYDAGRLEPLGEMLADVGFTDDRVFMFVARDLRPVARGLESDEHIEVVLTPLAEAYRMVDAGEILDAGTLVALYRFRSRAGS